MVNDFSGKHMVYSVSDIIVLVTRGRKQNINNKKLDYGGKTIIFQMI